MVSLSKKFVTQWNIWMVVKLNYRLTNYKEGKRKAWCINVIETFLLLKRFGSIKVSIICGYRFDHLSLKLSTYFISTYINYYFFFFPQMFWSLTVKNAEESLHSTMILETFSSNVYDLIPYISKLLFYKCMCLFYRDWLIIVYWRKICYCIYD